MTTLDQKRMLKLAGLLKEGVEEWIDETAPDMEKVPHANVDADLDIPMGYAPGEDQSDDRKEDLYSLYSDMYKEINGIRPRWVRPEELSVEDLEMMVKDLQNDIDVSIEDQDWYDYRSKIADEDYEKETEIRELQPSAEEEEDQRLPKQMSMRKSGNRPRFPSLEETYIDSMNESLEEAPPPHDPEERKAAGLNPLPKDEKGPFGEELPRGNKFGAETLKANPGLVELHEIIRSLVRAVLLEKTKK